MRIINFTALSVVLFFFLCGCQQQTEPTSTAFVEASQAYLDSFGEPPTAKEGRGFARVAYLPLRNSPGKLRAIPLFLFAEQDQLQQLLGRLTGGELVLPPDRSLFQPFPTDLQIRVKSLENGSLTLTLTSQQLFPAAHLAAAARSLSETALQLPEVERVFILLNNVPLTQMPAGGYQPAPQQLVAVAPPALLMIAGMWEKGAAGPDEILINFDRPIKVNSFQLSDASGQKVEGEYFTSVFQMSVVVHPAAAGSYPEGTLLNVTWDVSDTLGRSNRGENSLPLQRFEH